MFGRRVLPNKDGYRGPRTSFFVERWEDGMYTVCGVRMYKTLYDQDLECGWHESRAENWIGVAVWSTFAAVGLLLVKDDYDGFVFPAPLWIARVLGWMVAGFVAYSISRWLYHHDEAI